MWLEWPKPIWPRSTVAPPSCISRALSTMASCSGKRLNLSSSPKKMRSSTASRGICISGPLYHIDGRGQHEADPHRDQTQRHRQTDIAAGTKPFAVVHKIKRLQAERGERREAAADADHHELPRGRANENAAVRTGEGGKEADDERATDIDDERAPRKRLANRPRHHAGQPVASGRSQRAADCNPNVAFHRIRFPSLLIGQYTMVRCLPEASVTAAMSLASRLAGCAYHFTTSTGHGAICTMRSARLPIMRSYRAE